MFAPEPPDTIEVMTLAMNAALATLPHPVSSKYVQLVAETILRTAKDGERDPTALERMALLKLKLAAPLVVAVTQKLCSHLPAARKAQSMSANCGDTNDRRADVGSADGLADSSISSRSPSARIS
jgi:hypothetical protein